MKIKLGNFFHSKFVLMLLYLLICFNLIYIYSLDSDNTNYGDKDDFDDKNIDKLIMVIQQINSFHEKYEEQSHDKTTHVKMAQDLKQAMDLFLGIRLYEEDLWKINFMVFIQT